MVTQSASGFLNTLDERAARAALHRCCASSSWVEKMVIQRPFANDAALLEAADSTWRHLDARDWLEAFAAHPRIGDRDAPGWSREEQAGIRDVARAISDRLRALNQRYEERFGHVFLICATGRRAAELIAELERRIANDASMEIREAAEEQRKITRLRLQKLGAS